MLILYKYSQIRKLLIFQIKSMNKIMFLLFVMFCFATAKQNNSMLYQNSSWSNTINIIKRGLDKTFQFCKDNQPLIKILIVL